MALAAAGGVLLSACAFERAAERAGVPEKPDGASSAVAGPAQIEPPAQDIPPLDARPETLPFTSAGEPLRLTPRPPAADDAVIARPAPPAAVASAAPAKIAAGRLNLALSRIAETPHAPIHALAPRKTSTPEKAVATAPSAVALAPAHAAARVAAEQRPVPHPVDKPAAALHVSARIGATQLMQLAMAGVGLAAAAACFFTCGSAISALRRRRRPKRLQDAHTKIDAAHWERLDLQDAAAVQVFGREALTPAYRAKAAVQLAALGGKGRRREALAPPLGRNDIAGAWTARCAPIGAAPVQVAWTLQADGACLTEGGAVGAWEETPHGEILVKANGVHYCCRREDDRLVGVIQSPSGALWGRIEVSRSNVIEAAH